MEVFIFSLTFLLMMGLCQSDCDINTGPSGSPECVELDGYTGMQWATCLTDTYIQTFSKGKHRCEYFGATYCYYQCMMEQHTLRYGTVTDDCSCNNTEVTKLSEATTIIPNWCLSPPGTDCTWYRNCLEKSHPCQRTGDSYAIDYAEKFCQLYEENASKFDTKGNEWINAVRKCLQVKLVPVLRSYISITCDEIKQKAFDSHTDCYLSPGEGAPSICDIGPNNWMKVFATVKGAFSSDTSQSLKQFLKVGYGCTGYFISEVKVLVISLYHRVTGSHGGGKSRRSSQTDNIDWQVTQRVIQPLAEHGKWSDNGIIYFGSEDPISSEVSIYLIPAKGYDLNYKGNVTANTSSAALDAANAVNDGTVRFDLPVGLEAKQLSICDEYTNNNCSAIALTVDVPAKPTSTGTRCCGHILPLWFVAVWWLLVDGEIQLHQASNM